MIHLAWLPSVVRRGRLADADCWIRSAPQSDFTLVSERTLESRSLELGRCVRSPERGGSWAPGPRYPLTRQPPARSVEPRGSSRCDRPRNGRRRRSAEAGPRTRRTVVAAPGQRVECVLERRRVLGAQPPAAGVDLALDVGEKATIRRSMGSVRLCEPHDSPGRSPVRSQHPEERVQEAPPLRRDLPHTARACAATAKLRRAAG